MPGFVKMVSRVSARRTVAAADMAALQTEAQVDPLRAAFEAFFTSRRVRRFGFETIQMFAFHGVLPRFWRMPN